MTDYLVGVDLGGTTFSVLALTAEGDIVREQTVETKSDAAHWKEAIQNCLNEWRSGLGGTPRAIGVAAPGLTAPDGLSIAWMPGRLQGLEGLEWRELLCGNVPVRVLNDGHAALLGEAWRGAARDARNVVLLTLGTGVGGAILSEGRLLRGTIGRAGHLGHISLNPDGKNGITGTAGSLEDAVGNATLGERSGGRFSDTQELVAAMHSGDRDAGEIWLTSVRALGAGIVSIVNAIDPEIVVLGGGITDAGAALFDPLTQYLDKHEWRPGGHRVRVVAAELGRLAGAYGAAYYASSESL